MVQQNRMIYSVWAVALKKLISKECMCTMLQGLLLHNLLMNLLKAHTTQLP